MPCPQWVSMVCHATHRCLADCPLNLGYLVQVQAKCTQLVSLLRQLAALHEQAAFQGYTLSATPEHGYAPAPSLLLLKAQALAAAAAQLETLLAMQQHLRTESGPKPDAHVRRENQVTPWLTVVGMQPGGNWAGNEVGGGSSICEPQST